MPVSTQHPAYNHKITRWMMQRDAYAGEDAVKAKGTTYLDKPEGFQDSHFNRYVRRAKWYGATARTTSGMVGAVFHKPMDRAILPVTEPHLENITLSGIDFDSFSRNLFQDVILVSRYGVLLDYSESTRRPFWAGFPAESIINWETRTIGGQERLWMVVLHEEMETREPDGFGVRIGDRYRVLFINADGQYQVSIFENTDRERDTLIPTQQFIPRRQGRALNFIPFQFFGSEYLTPDVSKGPIEDLVNINFANFRHSADYEHALFLTGLPTPVVTGHTNPDDVMMIGALTAWILPNPDAKAYYLEYQGMGLESHERAMDNDKVEMATLGARLLEEPPEVQETLGAVQLRHSGDTGSLKSIAEITSQGLTNLMRWHHWWAGATAREDDTRVEISLNTDLAAVKMGAQELLALMQTWQQGGMSTETYLWNLQQGERLPPGVTPEDEMRRIETDAPARLPGLPFGNESEEPTPEAAA